MTGRGTAWTRALASGEVERLCGSVVAADAPIGDEMARLLCVVDDPASPYRRARRGEIGIREALALADAVRAVIGDDGDAPPGRRRPIVAVVDAPSQAYGRLEETVGLHVALAAAVDAYTTARRAGHPVVALIVGSAISGAFLAHGLMAGRIVALDAPGVEVQAMNRRIAARITRRTVEELDQLGRLVAPLSYDVGRWATLGRCDDLLTVEDANRPTAGDVDLVCRTLAENVARARQSPPALVDRLDDRLSAEPRTASLRARAAVRVAWD